MEIRNELLKRENIGLNIFRLGIFLLPTAFSISVILFLICLVIRFFENDNKAIIKEKWNFPLFLISLLMLISCFYSGDLINKLHLYNIPEEVFNNWQPYLVWIDLFNWIPMFLIYVYFQKYLITTSDRQKVGTLLLMGSIPILVSGFLQIWFDKFGPYKLFNGFIVWYQIEQADRVFTSVFSNPNYAGNWLNVIWPFCLALIINKNKFLQKIFLIIIGMFTSLAIYETSSRNAWLSHFISTLLLGNRYILIFSFIFFLSVITLILLARFNLNPALQEYFRTLTPSKFWNTENIFTLTNLKALPRLDIWINTLEFIAKKPLLGWGAGSFPILYEYKKITLNNPSTDYPQHTHNLFLLLAFNYGIITLIIFMVFLFLLIKRSIIKYQEKTKLNSIKKKDLIFDKAWIISPVMLLISQMFDIQYYDGRVSLTLWILLAGLRNF